MKRSKQDREHISWLARQIYLEGVFKVLTTATRLEDVENDAKTLTQTSLKLAEIWLDAAREYTKAPGGIAYETE